MKIGITLNMSQNFWSNGLNQNVKLLSDLFQRLGHTVYYITNQDVNKKQFNFKPVVFCAVTTASFSFDFFVVQQGQDIPSFEFTYLQPTLVFKFLRRVYENIFYDYLSESLITQYLRTVSSSDLKIYLPVG